MVLYGWCYKYVYTPSTSWTKMVSKWVVYIWLRIIRFHIFNVLYTHGHIVCTVKPVNPDTRQWRLVCNPDNYIFVTGFWKTGRIVTLGLFHFIGPANSYTHTLPIHSAITRLSWLVCFSRASFDDHINSQLRQQDPWWELHGRHGSEINPSSSDMSLRLSRHVWAYNWHFLDS